MKKAFIIRFHYAENDPRFTWRFEYFKNEVLPRILKQGDDFDICIRCNPHHDNLFLNLHKRIKVFHMKDEYVKHNGQRFFYDFLPFENAEGLEKYNVQFGLDSDDLIDDDYADTLLKALKPAIERGETGHVSMQCDYYDVASKEFHPAPNKYSLSRGSAFFAIYQPDNTIGHYFPYHESHITIAKRFMHRFFIPEIKCHASVHTHNESTYIPKKVIFAYWYPSENFGDSLTPIVLKYFLKKKIVFKRRGIPGRIVGIGSIVHKAEYGDIVFGSGSNKPLATIDGKGIRYLAVRGPLTRGQIINADVPEVYGDPALLLPLMYNPKIEKKYKRGIIPHYIDKKLMPPLLTGDHYIDIMKPWTEVIQEVLSCEEIVSTSLHGLIVAEAYGIPATWEVWSDNINGGVYKYHDYLLGTGRKIQDPGRLPPIKNLKQIQDKLLVALEGI